MKLKTIALYGGLAALAVTAGTMVRRRMKRSGNSFMDTCRGFMVNRKGKIIGIME